jgi:hypothetical protein
MVSTSGLPATRFASRCALALAAAAWYRPRYGSIRNGAATVERERECRSNVARVRPNTSLKLTRYGRRCKPSPRHMVHHRELGLQHPPPRAA